MENDGALSFDEMDGYAPDIPYDDLSDIFDLADKNDNNLLIGAEFDGYIHHVEKYYKDLEKQKKDKKEKSSQTSSKSNPLIPG